MNKSILMGRVCKDIELEDKKGFAYCAFTLAVDRRFVKAGEEKTADFIRIEAWRKTAEFVSKWFSKGNKILVVGSMRTRHWTGDNGKEVYATSVVIDEAYFTESKKEQHGDAYEPTETGVKILDKMAEFSNDQDESDLPF